MRADRWTKPVIAALLLGPLVLAVAPSGATSRRSGPQANGTATDALPVPPLLAAYPGGNVGARGTNRVSLGLCEIQGPHDWGAGVTTVSWGYTPALADGTCPDTGNTYLGPTIEARQGVPIAVKATNHLPVGDDSNPLGDLVDGTIEGAEENEGGPDIDAPKTALHLHGGHVTVTEDGDPDQVFPPGTTETYEYPNDQEATNLWYHDHAMGTTRLNVMNGLAGFYLLRDHNDSGRVDNPVGLPAPYGDPSQGGYEVPLVLQDRSFAGGRIDYGLGPWAGTPQAGKLCGTVSGPPPAGCTVTYPTTWQPEFFGDTATVNGKIRPHADVKRGVYRFRVINGSNARFYDLRLSDPTVPIYQIGAEGGLLDAPVRLESVLVAPGERADLLVDFTKARAGSHITLTNDAPAPYPGGGAPELPTIMRFDVGSATGTFTRVPARLRVAGGPRSALTPPATILARYPNIRTRDVFLNELLDPVTGEPVGLRLDNLPFASNKTQIETPKAGTPEVWNIVNLSADSHPIHLHLAMFRVLDRRDFVDGGEAYLDAVNARIPQGDLPDPVAGNHGPWPNAPGSTLPRAGSYPLTAAQPAGPTEAGWKDTVQVPPGGVTRILVVWGDEVAGSPFSGPTYTVTADHHYVWHCHILEHEENDMMQYYGPATVGN